MLPREGTRCVALLAALALASQGCTLVGLGVGSAIPRYESVTVDDLRAIPKGTSIRVRRDPASAFGPTQVNGAFAGLAGSEIRVETERDGTRSIHEEEARDIEVRDGSYALPFTLGGLAIDAIVLGVVLYGMSQSKGALGAFRGL